MSNVYKKCNEELQASLDFISDSLKERGIEYVLHQDEGNPNNWMIVTVDSSKNVNVGLASWEDKGGLTFGIRGPFSEIVDGKEEMLWYVCGDPEILFVFLSGEANSVARQAEEITKKSVDK